MRVSINGVQIGFEDIGQGPVVLFIHDYLLDRQMWRPQVDPLVAAGFRVILADLRGCGESEQTKEPVAIKTYSADIIGLLDYLGIGRAAVCELSFGGSVLGNLLENHPQRIAGAYLASSQSILAPQNRALAETLKIIGHRNNETIKLPTLRIGAECNPITHQQQPAPTAGQSSIPDRPPKLDSGRLVNMENVQEFNRNLLEFLTNLAPRKKSATVTPLSSAA
jgi:pimeloyl-ACP methyl ester carboxylesterase